MADGDVDDVGGGVGRVMKEGEDVGATGREVRRFNLRNSAGTNFRSLSSTMRTVLPGARPVRLATRKM